MRFLIRFLLAAVIMASGDLWQWQFSSAEAGALKPLAKTPVEFAAINGWVQDDHAAAFAAFRKSCKKLLSPKTELKPGESEIEVDPSVKAVCEVALLLNEKLSRDDARLFFEANFIPHLVKRPSAGALLTGYFEPEIRGSLTPSKQYPVPVYRRPGDLVLLTSATDRATLPGELTAARMTPEGPKPYYTRREIDEGVLKGRGLEIAYVSDAYEAFVMQVQGSGLIRLPDNQCIRIGFAGKNGHPYTSIGKLLIERGALMAQTSSMQSVVAWLRSDPQRARELMWENKSYPFFEVLDGAKAPQGAMTVPLTPGRSLAVDPRYHKMGMPIWVSAPEVKDMKGTPIKRLMVAQDTGSAIRGPVRGDFFWGSGPAAGKFAGETKHPCDFYVLVPK
jgi:membrane-bound lytic murein transglycosylase A